MYAYGRSGSAGPSFFKSTAAWRADPGNEGLAISLRAEVAARGGTVSSGVPYATDNPAGFRATIGRTDLFSRLTRQHSNTLTGALRDTGGRLGSGD